MRTLLAVLALSVLCSSQTVSVSGGSCTPDATGKCSINLSVSVAQPAPPPPLPVVVAITPTSASLQFGQQVAFSAAVANASDLTVTWSLAGAVGTIDQKGVFVAGAAGVGTVTATSVQDTTVSASATVTVTAGPVPVPVPVPTNVAGNPYCGPGGVWTGALTDGPAALPTQCMYTPLSATPSPGKVWGPVAASAFLSTYNSAACGDTILVQAGTSAGQTSLTRKNCDDLHWMTVQSTGISDPTFPAEGQRISACAAGVASMPGRLPYVCPTPKVLTAQFVAPSSGNALLANGADHIRFIGIDFTRTPTPGALIYNIVDLSSKATQTDHIIFDRNLFRGIEGTFPQTRATDTSTTRGVYLGQSNHIAIIDSSFYNFYDNGATASNGNTDSQCIGGGAGGIQNSGWGVYKFVNNHGECGSEGILLGGSGGPQLTPAGCTFGVNCNIDVPTNIEVRQNYFFAPTFWNGNTTTINATGYPNRKNGIEFKTGANILLEGNVFENCWYSSQPYCYAFDFAPKNQSNGAGVPTDPSALVQDFVARYNYGYNYPGPMIAIYSTMDIGCSTCSTLGRRGSVHDNLVGDLLNRGSLTGLTGFDGIEILADAGPMSSISITHNTLVNAVRSGILFGGTKGTNSFPGFKFQDNLLAGGSGVVVNGTNGADCTGSATTNNFKTWLDNCAGAGNWTVDHNAVFNWNTGSVQALGSRWPTNGSGLGNSFFVGTSGLGFSGYTTDSGFNPDVFALTTASPLHNAASDGKDVGADISALLKAIAGVRQ